MLLLAVIMTAFTGNALAYTPPEKPANGWYVVDQAGKLTDSQKTQLNTKIDNINKTTKNEFGVLIVQSLDGDDIEDAAQTTFRTWGIGKARLNNGILLMISAGDRKMRLQTGKGVEGDLPDLRAKDLLDEQLKPALKKGDWYGGIDQLIGATSGYLESRADKQVAEKSTSPVDAVPATDSSSAVATGGGIVAGLFIMLILGVVLFFTVVFLVVRHYSKKKEARLQAERDEFEAQQRRKRDLVVKEQAQRRQRDEDARQQRLALQTPYVTSSPSKSYASTTSNNPVATGKHYTATAVAIGAGAAAAVVGVGTAVAISAAAERELAAKRRRRDEEDAARRRRDEESSSSSYSSSSSWSSSDSGSSFDGGGFGGGDSGGGGASSDF